MWGLEEVFVLEKKEALQDHRVMPQGHQIPLAGNCTGQTRAACASERTKNVTNDQRSSGVHEVVIVLGHLC